MDQKEEKQKSSSSDFVEIFCLEEELAALEQNIITAKERLEKMQNELVFSKQKKKETEDQIKNILKDAKKKHQGFEEKVEVLARQKDSLEKQCGELSARYGTLSDDLTKISGTLRDKNDELKKVEQELRDARRGQKVFSKKRRFASVVAVISIMFVIFFGWIYFRGEVSSWEGLYEDAKAKKAESLAELSKLEGLYQGIKAEKEEALAKLSNIEKYAGPAIVKVNKVYNSGGNFHQISDELKASEMRYLSFVFDVYFLEDNVKEATIYLDIYKPDGSLDSSSSSPLGHTTSFEVNGMGTVHQCWGNASVSTYPAGTYRVDFIYKEEIIHSQKVVITK